MASRLAIHNPRDDSDNVPVRPADLPGLARARGPARRLRTFTPDLDDDWHVTLWEAESADDVQAAMAAFYFFVEVDTDVFRVGEWEPDNVLDVPADD